MKPNQEAEQAAEDTNEAAKDLFIRARGTLEDYAVDVVKALCESKSVDWLTWDKGAPPFDVETGEIFNLSSSTIIQAVTALNNRDEGPFFAREKISNVQRTPSSREKLSLYVEFPELIEGEVFYTTEKVQALPNNPKTRLPITSADEFLNMIEQSCEHIGVKVEYASNFRTVGYLPHNKVLVIGNFEEILGRDIPTANHEKKKTLQALMAAHAALTDIAPEVKEDLSNAIKMKDFFQPSKPIYNIVSTAAIASISERAGLGLSKTIKEEIHSRGDLRRAFKIQEGLHVSRAEVAKLLGRVALGQHWGNAVVRPDMNAPTSYLNNIRAIANQAYPLISCANNNQSHQINEDGAEVVNKAVVNQP